MGQGGLEARSGGLCRGNYSELELNGKGHGVTKKKGDIAKNGGQIIQDVLINVISDGSENSRKSISWRFGSVGHVGQHVGWGI